ncbi:ABC transporter ATP-binding protein [Virgibacillus necropolis]|uniref:Peptide ABC transporter ATP-binding protein n=1 Tax=Virgibacillus necropolis TaxID=163877 RepID=A0A221M948_9BACI|nr:ABC transporter ATP-binding protein [Virgibacillus necropolis]ASN04186.1 peptide ABC transporter ATP-binding protein [Virgibacillus necropolis]
MSYLLEVNNLKVGFTLDNHTTQVVRGVSFEVNKGEIVGIVGESGCGKSVTSLSMMRLLKGTSGKIQEGEIWFNDRNLLHLTEKEMRHIRGNNVSMIFQDPMTSLNPVLKIGKQLTQGIRLHLNYSKSRAKEYAIEMLKSVGIPRSESIMNEYPHQLSGGMCQRVMIAMAMSCKPELLIADEPTTALDVTIQAQILELMKQLRDENDTTILMITHDLGVVSEICDRVIVMYAGTVIEEGKTKEVFNDPKHPYTEGLIQSMPKIGEEQSRLYAIPGQVPDHAHMPKGCKFAPRCPYVMDLCKEKEPSLVTEADSRQHRCWLFQGEGIQDGKGSEKVDV